ncbi:6285_t:CDS:2 [Funneliformis geosporum]|uniref:13971_t:CDS:1 n=1 Tax=Funneliformis geosporum TaxID=1117311 RepID=A0A9W4SMP8_9GLOM|nr:6285_t:CDS:2 [Funneliformis geosporum]CAI2173897.1 13971_t:CDS:2 [Funneliformis geosporum]
MPRAYSTYSPYMQSNTGCLSQYPTPDTQPTTSNSQSEQTNTRPNSQTTTVLSLPTQDSFLSDVPQSVYSEYSTLDIPPAISTIQESDELTSYSPESFFFRESPALDSSPGDENTNSNNIRVDLNSPRRSPSNQNPDPQTDSLSLKSQDSFNNRELINESSITLALEGLSEPILSEITDSNLLQQSQSEHMRRETTTEVEENNGQNSTNFGNFISEQEFSTSMTDAENDDICGELRKVITKSTMILESVKSQEVDEMENVEYFHQEITEGDTQSHEVSQPDLLELECDHEQSEHYNNMASKLSNIGFVKVETGSDEEIENCTTSTTSATPRIRRSMRKRSKANYSFPRYSYRGKKSKTRKRSRTPRKVSSLSANENEANESLEVVNDNNEKNEETNQPVHELSPVQISDEQETNEGVHSGQSADDSEDSGNVNKNITDHHTQNILDPKYVLRSRKIFRAPSKKTARAKRSVKKSTSKVIPKTPIKTTLKRKTSRRKLIAHKTKKDPEWHPPDEADNGSGLKDDSEAVVDVPAKSISKDRHSTSKTRSALKEPNTSKKAKTKNIKIVDTTREIRTAENSSKKVTPRTSKSTNKRSTTKSTRGRGRGRGRGKGKGGSTRGSRSKNHDTEIKYPSGEEPSIINPAEVPVVGISTVVNSNSENQVVREQSDVEMNNVNQDEPEQVEEPGSTPKLIKGTRKYTRRLVGGSKSTKSASDGKKGRGKTADTRADDNAARDNDVNSEPSDEEETIPKTKPKKVTRSSNRQGQTRIGDNTATEQPPVTASDPDIVEISSINPTALANVVNTLAGQNYDILRSSENIVDIAPNKGPCTPVFVKPHVPTTRSSSPSNTPPPEIQAILSKPPTAIPSSLEWSMDHWHHLKVFYEETKSEYIRSGTDVNKNKDVYSEVIEKFFESDIKNRTFGEEDLRLRIISLETADLERNNEPSSDQQSSDIENSVILYNKAYSNLRAGNKRKRRESNVTVAVPGKEKMEDDENEGKVPKRSRVEEITPSGSGTTTPASELTASQTPGNNNMLSKLFGSWFNSGQRRSNTASLNEEAPEESANHVDENEDRMEDEQSTHTPRRSWLW